MTQVFTKQEVKELLQQKNLLEFNREISSRHVATMYESIEQCGILRLPVIADVSEFDHRKYAIADGQHLCAAFVKTKTNSIHCIVKKYKSKEDLIADVAKLNNVQKTWTDENYLNAWYKFGKDNIEHFSNYAYLWNIYNDVFDGLPCGFLVDVYALNKEGFRSGALEFKDQEVSDKIAQLSYMLKTEYRKGSYTLQGLRMWVFDRIFSQMKDLDFVKLQSRLKLALRNNEDKNCNGREDFRDFCELIYTRL